MNIKYNTKQRYTSIQGLRSFKDTLPKEAKRILNKKGEAYNKTIDNWKYIVGKELFKECYPKSFKGSNKVKNSCLTIMVKRGSEVNLEYSKNEIIKKMNAFFGYEVVQTIKLNTFDGFLEKKLKKSPDYATKNKHIKMQTCNYVQNAQTSSIQKFKNIKNAITLKMSKRPNAKCQNINKLENEIM